MIKHIKFTLLALLASLLLLGGQCKPDLDKTPLKIMNNSKRTIFVNINNDWPGVDPTYPDTTIQQQIPGFHPIIPPGQRASITEGRLSWISTFEYIGDTLSITVYDVDTLNKYPWETIREQYMILQRYDLSIYDLQKLNYTLHYPPTEAMRNMKMWPKYGAVEK